MTTPSAVAVRCAMSRYIKLADALQTLADTCYLDEIDKNMQGLPSIDIVRCKECKHWHREINENGIEYVNFSKCTKGHYGNGLDFHCADGERREP